MKSGRGRVRIIGGRWRGRRIRFPEVPGLRPTPDRVRETLFNWLAPWLAGARVLDLFAGSGILAFEALSRGASRAVLVESDRQTARCLLQTGAGLDGADFEVLPCDALAFLQSPGHGPFDLVFLDPPYAFEDHEALCRELDESGILEPGAFVYLELAARRAEIFGAPASWEAFRSARAGQVRYQLWRRAGRAAH